MWEALGESIKVFVEKHLIPSIISLAVALVGVLFIPEDNWMYVKLGKAWFAVLVGCVTFLVVELVVVAFKGIKRGKRKISNKAYERKQDIEREKDNLNKLWESVDSWSPEERKIIAQFLETENKPIVLHPYEIPPYGSLFQSNWVVSTKIRQNVDGDEGYVSLGTTYMHDGSPSQYKLKEDIYEMLKYSKEKYGKISNFE